MLRCSRCKSVATARRLAARPGEPQETVRAASTHQVVMRVLRRFVRGGELRRLGRGEIVHTLSRCGSVKSNLTFAIDATLSPPRQLDN